MTGANGPYDSPSVRVTALRRPSSLSFRVPSSEQLIMSDRSAKYATLVIQSVWRPFSYVLR